MSFIKTVQKLNRQTLVKRAGINNGCGAESKEGGDLRVSLSPELSDKMLTRSF